MPMPTKPCKYCNEVEPKHWPYQCLKSPKKSARLSGAVRIPKNGKEHRKWLKTRRQWFMDNKADHYICYLGGDYLTPAETTLDHVESRSGNPSLRHDYDNLMPACAYHNGLKGSMSVDQFFEKYPELKYFSPLFRNKPLES